MGNQSKRIHYIMETVGLNAVVLINRMGNRPAGRVDPLIIGWLIYWLAWKAH